MAFLYGSALLVAAFTALCAGRRLLAGLGPKQDDEILDPAELLAFALTGVAAFGLSKIALAAFSDWSVTTALQLGATLAATVVACYVLRLVVARVLPARVGAGETPQTPQAPQTPPHRGRRRDTASTPNPALPEVQRAA